MTPAEAYRAALPGELVETDLSAFDRTGSAVHSVALLAPPGGNGIGYGPDREAASTSAYGELVEWTRSHAVLSRAEPVTASYAELGERAQDPRTLCLEAGSAWTPDTPLRWLPARRLRDDAEVLVPVELLASRPVDLAHLPGPWLTTVITNGLGAGLDRSRALSHALLELLQRDGNGLVFRALDRGVVVDLDGLTDPAALQALSRLREAGVEPVVKLASTAFGLTNVYAVGIDSDPVEPISATACGEASHPDREVAVRKALLELCSARARKAFAHGSLDRVRALAGDDYLDRYLAALPDDAVQREEPRALAAMQEWLALGPGLVELLRDSVLSQRSVVPLADLPTTKGLDSTEALAADVTDRLHRAGLDVLVLDLSGDGVHAVKAVVPGLEVETMSYGRIGERGVARARSLDLPFVTVGDDPGGWDRVHLTAAAEERLGGPAWLDRAGREAAVGALYPLYREPGRHLAQLGLQVAA
jgi:thiazole/oxazole-forming peptide maturase SagD family component